MLNIELNTEEETLSFDRFQERYAWAKDQQAEIKLSGIEPLIHPQIVEITKQISEETFCAIYTKLDCDTEILKEILKIKKVKIIIIPSENPNNKIIANLEYLKKSVNQIKSKNIWISIFLDFSTENDYIKNTNATFETLKIIAEITNDIIIRISPDEKNYNNIRNTKTQITSLYQTIARTYQHITFFFPCMVNNCIFTPKFLGELLECTQIKNLRFKCTDNEIFIDIKDRIHYCFFSKARKLERETFKSIKNLKEAKTWFDQKKFSPIDNTVVCLYKTECQTCYYPMCKGTCYKGL